MRHGRELLHDSSDDAGRHDEAIGVLEQHVLEAGLVLLGAADLGDGVERTRDVGGLPIRGEVAGGDTRERLARAVLLDPVAAGAGEVILVLGRGDDLASSPEGRPGG